MNEQLRSPAPLARPPLPTLAAAALSYATDGYPVFPVQARGKRPLTSHGLLDATTDLDTVRRFWSATPGANIGLAVPPGLVVVDVDDRNALQRLKAEDLPLPATCRCTTGRGLHLYYRTAVEIRNAVALFPGVDLRGPGGYVVAPPSIHPTGRRYRWEVPLVPGHLAEAPVWLAETVRQTRNQPVRPAAEWRNLTAQGVGRGERNSSLASLAGHLLRRGIDPFVALDLLQCWNATRCRPPLPEAEVVRTVDSIAGRELRRRNGHG